MPFDFLNRSYAIGIMREGILVSVTEAKDIPANELEELYLQTV